LPRFGFLCVRSPPSSTSVNGRRTTKLLPHACPPRLRERPAVEKLKAMTDAPAERLTELVDRLRVAPGSKVTLSDDCDPAFKPGWLKKKDGPEHLELSAQRLAEYQQRLAAEATWGVVVVLQGIDASGKDSTIRHVMSGVNPQGVRVHSFKVPSDEELSHDFLWRYARQLPSRGQIGIFNRSHYEEVLVVRVHPHLLDPQRLPPSARRGDVWGRRYRDINDWERYLVDNGFKLVKLFLNISREEQRSRFLKRIDRPEKNWKFAASDVEERAWWDEYQQVFSEMLTHTSTAWAPWYVIPADRKWFARIAVGAVIGQALTGIDPQYPTVSEEARQALEEARRRLEAEAPEGAARDPYLAKHSTA
jgi:PPK2 family polyphosphate:nucleotide phosphotransferase